jgi:hypothetical protein
MPDVIQCPTCSKRFKLPERPPAVFTCTGCGTAMDLSAFRAAAPAAAAAAPSETGDASSAASASRRSSRAGSSSRPGSRTSARAGARGRRDRGGDDEGEGGHGLPPKKSNAMVWVAIGAGVVIIFGVILATQSGPKTSEVGADTLARQAAAEREKAAAAAAAAAAASTPAAMTDEPPPEPPKEHVTAAKVQMKDLGHHPDSTEDEKQQIDTLVQQAVFQDLGRDSQRAENKLVEIGVKAAPRLISVFGTVKAGETFEDKQGRKKCGVADSILRRIDGWLDRKSNGRLPLIRAATQARDVEHIGKQWYVWWENGLYKEPKKPWDERSEGNRGEGRAAPEDGASMSGS